MRHRKAGLKLGRNRGHRNALFRNLVTSLFKHDRIRTTDVKAKELRRWADRMVTLAKRGDLHARRQALAVIREPAVVHRLFEKAAERFGRVAGGYTRITKLGFRPGDGAPVTLVELIGAEGEEKKKKRGKKKPAAGRKAEAARKKAPAAGGKQPRPAAEAEPAAQAPSPEKEEKPAAS